MVPIPKRESHCLRNFFPFKICKEVYGKPKLCSKFRLLSDMKKKRMTKLLAAILSGVLLTSALPAVSPVSVLAADNLISNSTFSSGTSGWGMYKESGGAATLSTEDGKLALHVTNTGKLTYSVQLNYDIIPLYKNGVYHLSYEISSDTDRYVEGMIQQNGGTYQSYTWKGLNLTSEPQKVDYEFTMKADTDIMSKMVFNCGNEGEELGEHTIYLDNVVLELVDDSQVDYSEIRAYEPPIVINQVGYRPNAEKVAVFRGITDETEFSVVNAETEEVVYTGELYGETNNSSAGEVEWMGDFSAVEAPGKYYITCGGLDPSYTFEIGEDVYSDLMKDVVRMLYLQRCGTEIEDDTFHHVACHTTKARVYGTTDEYIDVSGGWHDAGDYGRYTVPAAKTVADMLYAYQANPALFGDDVGIPESGNGVPDILDEAKYALTWMLKMQDPETGGVHHKVTCENFPGYVMPEQETGELIVTKVSTTATGDFCGAMALASEFFGESDPNFAATCLDAAKKAWNFLDANPNLIFKNPTDITTGDYGDYSDSDERYWATAQMFRATGEEAYKEKLEGMYLQTGMDWTTVGDYGNLAILTMKDGESKIESVYQKALSAMKKQANTFVSTSNKTPFGVSISTFNWGSNMTIGNAGVILGVAAQITGDDAYRQAAEDDLNYLLGKNATGYCFVTGYGTLCPQNPHHRPSMAKKQAMKGMLVGGVNSAKEDSAAKAYLAGMPSAKCYVDHSESYSTNEVATYWNSPLIYLLALAQTEEIPEPAKGDVNLDGEINLADAVALQKYLIYAETLTQDQWQQADLTEDNVVNGTDLALLRSNLAIS